MKSKVSVRASYAVVITVGILIGVGIYTFWYGMGHSYLSDAPEVCLNCHIMRESYSSWATSSHRSVVCNDCHLPHDMVPKYAAKAENGFRHSAAFTFGDVQVLHATASTSANIDENCVRCHGNMMSSVLERGRGESIRCTRCDRRVGHTL